MIRFINRAFKLILKCRIFETYNHDNRTINFFKQNLSQLGSGVIQIVWFTVTERPDLHPNMVTLLRKTLTVLKSYNPYTAAEEAESGVTG